MPVVLSLRVLRCVIANHSAGISDDVMRFSENTSSDVISEVELTTFTVGTGEANFSIVRSGSVSDTMDAGTMNPMTQSDTGRRVS